MPVSGCRVKLIYHRKYNMATVGDIKLAAPLKTCLRAYTDSEGPDQAVHSCSLISAFHVHKQFIGYYRLYKWRGRYCCLCGRSVRPPTETFAVLDLISLAFGRNPKQTKKKKKKKKKSLQAHIKIMPRSYVRDPLARSINDPFNKRLRDHQSPNASDLKVIRWSDLEVIY